VDFVLTFGSHFIVAECKRADPALATWCFAQTPFVRRNQRRAYPMFTAVIPDQGGSPIVDDMPHRLATDEPVYQIAHELRTRQKGDGIATGRQALKDAVTQVFRSAGGWIEMLKNEKRLLSRSEALLIVPTIFTTAELFVSDDDLAAADLKTGNLAQIAVTPKSWVWYQAHLSGSLRPTLRMNPIRDDWSPSGLLLIRHTRSVAVVNVSGIQEFLRSLCDEDFQPERI
jgi:hypothetical protein